MNESGENSDAEDDAVPIPGGFRMVGADLMLSGNKIHIGGKTRISWSFTMENNDSDEINVEGKIFANEVQIAAKNVQTTSTREGWELVANPLWLQEGVVNIKAQFHFCKDGKAFYTTSSPLETITVLKQHS